MDEKEGGELTQKSLTSDYRSQQKHQEQITQQSQSKSMLTSDYSGQQSSNKQDSQVKKQLVSDYRSQQHSTSGEMPQNKRASYKSVVKSAISPMEDQGIIIDAKDGIQLKEYIHAVARIFGSSNIQFASRISNNIICMFLSSSEVANKLIEEHNSPKAHDQDIELIDAYLIKKCFVGDVELNQNTQF